MNTVLSLIFQQVSILLPYYERTDLLLIKYMIMTDQRH